MNFQFMRMRGQIYFLLSVLLLLSIVSFAQEKHFFLPPQGKAGVDYDPQTVIVRLRPSSVTNARTAQISGRQLIQNMPGVARMEKAVRRRQAISPVARQTAKTDIEHIYRLQLETGQALEPVIRALLQLEEVVYAEPYYLLKPLSQTATEYVPNDPKAAKSGGAQSYLGAVGAYQAWAKTKGDTSITIGVLDTGIEFGHQDLSDNLKRNYDDPINGIDDDNDGYIDNYQGWDFSDNDNDATADQNAHGVLVNGVAAASTDNNVGIAGLGFNSTYMPIKIFRSTDGTFNQGYEAIAYAADMGCQVINLSWGGANAYSNFGQDMINYAVLERDAVVVAAAGNSGQFEDFYPASFDNVLSVAQSDNNGNRLSATTSSYFVDLVAPGSGIYTTDQNDGYRNVGGSSLATPMVSGTAALMRSYYPQLSARQIMEKLRLSADDIYDQSANAGYQDSLGRGFLNMPKALTDQLTPALRMTSFSYKNHVGAYAFYGDTLSISADFTNFLSPAEAATVTLSSPSSYVTLLDSVFSIGSLDSLATVTNTTEPFRVYLHEDMPPYEQLYFRLSYQAEGYSDYQYFFIVASPDYVELNNSKIRTFLESKGQLGVSLSRDGLIYQGDTLARHLGFMLAAGQDSVSDNIINDIDLQTYNSDFSSVENIRFGRSSTADLLLTSTFRDTDATNPLSLRVEQEWLTDTSGTAQDFLISSYRVINRGADSVFSLYPALYADWDIGDALQNRAAWDATSSLAYTHDGNFYSGLALLGEQTAAHYAIDKLDLNGNTADLQNAFTDSLRYAWISSATAKDAAGVSGAGNDVAQLLGTKIDTLAPGHHAQVAMAWVFGSSLSELQQQLAEAQAKYDTYRQNPPVSQLVYTCTDSTVTIIPEEAGLYRFFRDPLGSELLGEDSLFTTGTLAGDTVIYTARVQDAYQAKISQVDIRMLMPQAAFDYGGVDGGSVRNDTLFLNSADAATLSFTDQSSDAVAWQWSFGNGYQSAKRMPSAQYIEEGTYTLSLLVNSAADCESFVSRTLTVIRKAEKPEIQNQTLCQHGSVSLTASNTSEIKVFGDSTLTQLIYSGDTFTSGPLTSDSIFYVVNAASEYESVPAEVQISVIQPAMGIGYAPDLAADGKYQLKLWALPQDETYPADAYEWFVGSSSIGSGDTIVYDYSLEHENAQDIEVMLSFSRSHNTLSCQQEVSKLINLSSSPIPTFENQRVCRGESVDLVPKNGAVFYFYNDSSLAEPVYRGSHYTVSDVQGEMTFYITGIDSLLESKPTEVQVVLNRFADFSMSEDTLFLQEGQEVVFEGMLLNESAKQEVNWQWDLGDGQLLTRESRVTQDFDTVGDYRIRMVATTRDGCTNTVTRTLIVKNITAVEHALEDKSLLLYPNPNSGRFTLANARWDYKKIMLHLYDRQGKALCNELVLYNDFPVEVDLHRLTGQLLPSGIYMLRLEVDDKAFTRQILLKPE